MGIDKDRFQSDVRDYFICPLCEEVFAEPVMVKQCQDSFCRQCLCQWLEEDSSCPNNDCQQAIDDDGDWTNNKTLEKIMSGLQVTCQFASFGCDQVVSLSSLSFHTAVCLHNPDLNGSDLFQSCTSQLMTPDDEQQVNQDHSLEMVDNDFADLSIEFKQLQSYKTWLMTFPINTKDSHRQYVDLVKQNQVIASEEDWNKTEEVLMRCACLRVEHWIKEGPSVLFDQYDYFTWFIPTVLSTLQDQLQSLGSCGLIHVDRWGRHELVCCCALMMGPGGRIYTNFNNQIQLSNEKCQLNKRLVEEGIFNSVDIDFNNKRLLQNGQKLSNDIAFDFIITVIDPDKPIEVFLDRLKPGGRVVKFNNYRYQSFDLMEKLLNGETVKHTEVRLDLPIYRQLNEYFFGLFFGLIINQIE